MKGCQQYWDDKIGCDRPGEHHCVHAELPHRWHLCHCGAEMWDTK